jgi:hypothetical protein
MVAAAAAAATSLSVSGVARGSHFCFRGPLPLPPEAAVTATNGSGADAMSATRTTPAVDVECHDCAVSFELACSWPVDRTRRALQPKLTEYRAAKQTTIATMPTITKIEKRLIRGGEEYRRTLSPAGAGHGSDFVNP